MSHFQLNNATSQLLRPGDSPFVNSWNLAWDSQLRSCPQDYRLFPCLHPKLSIPGPQCLPSLLGTYLGALAKLPTAGSSKTRDPSVYPHSNS